MNRQDNDLLANLRVSLNEHGIDSFHILEDLVPIEEQVEYFRYFEQLRRADEPFTHDEEIFLLFSPDTPVERKKRSLSLLASIPDVSAYRAIETYHSSPQEPELHNWSSMALVNSRIVLRSDLSGQQQIYISSGLGGHNHKLRSFVLFATREQQPLTTLQREIVEREFEFQLKHADVDIEKFDIRDSYFTILLLFPFDVDIRPILNSALSECNNYGEFLDTWFLFTNMKILNEKEIEDFLTKKIMLNP